MLVFYSFLHWDSHKSMLEIKWGNFYTEKYSQKFQGRDRPVLVCELFLFFFKFLFLERNFIYHPVTSLALDICGSWSLSTDWFLITSVWWSTKYFTAPRHFPCGITFLFWKCTSQSWWLVAHLLISSLLFISFELMHSHKIFSWVIQISIECIC